MTIQEVKDHFLTHDVLRVDNNGFTIPHVKALEKANHDRFELGRKWDVSTVIEVIIGIGVQRFDTERHPPNVVHVHNTCQQHGGFEVNKDDWDFWCHGPAFILVTKRSPFYNKTAEFFYNLGNTNICCCSQSGSVNDSSALESLD
jgi:hypothetical protein